ASVGGVLAAANINIAGLSLGRSGVGEKALTIMSVDNEIPAGVIKQIESIDGILDVKVVSL
ncbi:MAG: ACT domain-containing protein, partial [Opitutaceae bacterium]